MADLFTSLSMASRALAAQQTALAVTGQNIANINTPGYVRRTAELTAVAPTGARSAGEGVDVTGIRAERANLLEAQLRQELPSQGRDAAMAGALSQIETALGTPGSSVAAGLTRFYGAFSQLANDPTSGVAREQVVVQAQSLGNVFNEAGLRLSAAQRDADKQVKADVDQINKLATRIAALNATVTGGLAEQSGFEAVRDQLDTALTSLSQLIDIGVLTRTDGGVDVSVGNGHALVIGSNKYAIGVSPRPATGLSDLVTAGGHVMTAQVTGGSVGGMLQVRDRLLPGYMTQLDQLAFDVAGSVNTAHRAGFDLAGTAGGDFFAPPAAVAGAARTLSVTAALVANSNLIAAAGTPAPGDNQNARAITNLQQAALGSGTTNPVDTWASLVYRVGSDAQGAKSELGGHAEVVRQLQTLRDQVSAVSLDEEAANLTKFQMAYQANARYFSVIQTSLDQLMQMGGF